MKSKKDIEKQIARLEKKHDQIENPLCYLGKCPICQKMDELQKELKSKEKKRK